jgi:hypothetical protein
MRYQLVPTGTKYLSVSVSQYQQVLLPLGEYQLVLPQAVQIPCRVVHTGMPGQGFIAISPMPVAIAFISYCQVNKPGFTNVVNGTGVSKYPWGIGPYVSASLSPDARWTPHFPISTIWSFGGCA